MRLPLASLAVLLDLPSSHEVTAVEVTGDFLDVTLDDDATTEVIAEYLVDVNGHRTFTQFALPAGTPEVVVGFARPVLDPEMEPARTVSPEEPVAVEETIPPSGRGSRTTPKKEG